MFYISQVLKACCCLSPATKLFFFAFFRRRRWTISGTLLSLSLPTSTTMSDAVWTLDTTSGTSAAKLLDSTDQPRRWKVRDGLSTADKDSLISPRDFEVRKSAEDGLATAMRPLVAWWGLLNCWLWLERTGVDDTARSATEFHRHEKHAKTQT